jgi:hypothetical protein
MSKPGIVAGQWRQYVTRVLPADVHPLQLKETKRAFYAGAQCLLYAVQQGLSAGDGVEDGDVAMLEAVERELSDFAEAVAQGRA